MKIIPGSLKQTSLPISSSYRANCQVARWLIIWHIIFNNAALVALYIAVHRLDRETSGCVIIAKDSHSQFLLEQQLQTGHLKRTYLALVKGIVTPVSGRIDAPIGCHPSLPNRRIVDKLGESAVTNYQTIQQFEDATLLELTLETGRTHQIRVHLAHLGYPVIGDNMYGVRTHWMRRQALHATALTFCRLQEGDEITVRAPLPEDFAQAIKHYANEKEPC